MKRNFFTDKRRVSKRLLNRLSRIMIVLAVSCVFHNTEAYGQQDLDEKYAKDLVAPGTMAPDITLQNPDGQEVSLKDRRGKYVVIDFWASWCPDCLRDIPEVKALYNRYSEKGVEFLGVSFDTDASRWKEAIKKHAIPFPQCSELKKMRESDVAKQYGVKWIPSLVIVDPDGKIALSTVQSYKIDSYLAEKVTGTTVKK